MSLRTSKSNGTNPRVIASGRPCCERTTDEAKENAETKGELSREDVHDILQGMQDPHEEVRKL